MDEVAQGRWREGADIGMHSATGCCNTMKCMDLQWLRHYAARKMYTYIRTYMLRTICFNMKQGPL
jgi:hypothetical protein